MKPYFQDESTTLYCCDCREVLPLFMAKEFDLLCIDPPYGVNAARDRHSQKHGWIDYGNNGWDKERPSIDLLELALIKADKAIIWGGNFFALPPRRGWLVWDKLQRDFSLSDCELAWTSENRASRVFSYSRALALQDGKRHPTQKPLALMRWCIKQMEPCASILDCFAGSGSTLVAAKQMGVKAIGVEISEVYCKIIIDRLRQSVFEFEEPEPTIEQVKLF